METVVMWLLIGFVLGMVFALTLVSGLRGPSQPVVLAAPAPPPVTLEGSGCASSILGLGFLLFVLFLLWFALTS